MLLHANQTVSMDRLAQALWGEDASAGAVKTVHVYVSRLRKALGEPEVLVTTPAGYRVRVDPGDLDLERFERQLAAGRHALNAGRPERAADLVRDALTLWRGSAARGVRVGAVRTGRDQPAGRAASRRAGGAHRRRLAAGRHAEVIPELHRLVGEHPLRERFHARAGDARAGSRARVAGASRAADTHPDSTDRRAWTRRRSGQPADADRR